MLRSYRHCAVPELDAHVSTAALAHSAYRVHVVRNANVVAEDALGLRAFDRLGVLSRPVLTVVRRGRACFRLPDGRVRWLGPGELIALPSKGGLSVRQEGARFESVMFEWDPGLLGATPREEFGRLSPTALARIEALTLALGPDALAPVAPAADALVQTLAALRADGLPLADRTAGDLIEPVAPAARRLSLALDSLVSDLAARPMAVDLERTLGLGARDAATVVQDFHRRYGFNAGGWRDTVNRRRILVGSAMMTAPGARTESVSAALGYSSPTSFCRAMAQAGLPSPSAIAAAVDALGAGRSFPP